jgi:metal-responsive CopG/Arc/MetJ family transcriptional regulator
MESITIKVTERMAEEIESFINPDYGTKTEFIREAIRNKIKEARKEKALNELKNYFGKSKTKNLTKEEKQELFKNFSEKNLTKYSKKSMLSRT